MVLAGLVLVGSSTACSIFGGGSGLAENWQPFDLYTVVIADKQVVLQGVDTESGRSEPLAVLSESFPDSLLPEASVFVDGDGRGYVVVDVTGEGFSANVFRLDPAAREAKNLGTVEAGFRPLVHGKSLSGFINRSTAFGLASVRLPELAVTGEVVFNGVPVAYDGGCALGTDELGRVPAQLADERGTMDLALAPEDRAFGISCRGDVQAVTVPARRLAGSDPKAMSTPANELVVFRSGAAPVRWTTGPKPARVLILDNDVALVDVEMPGDKRGLQTIDLATGAASTPVELPKIQTVTLLARQGDQIIVAGDHDLYVLAAGSPTAVPDRSTTFDGSVATTVLREVAGL